MSTISTVLVVGASGSIGRIVVDELLGRGTGVRVLVRPARAGDFPTTVDVRTGDITDPAAFASVLDGVDAVVFTHGSNGSPADNEAVDYGAVRNLLETEHGPLRIALMTTIGVTHPEIGYNRTSEVCDWKRRSERLVRASGLPYTIVRPSWFDYNESDAHAVAFEQGDTRSSGTSADGGVARAQIAQVLVGALFSDAAAYKTLELFSTPGPALADLTDSFAALDGDAAGSVDAVHDRDSQPLNEEPAPVLADLDAVRTART